jgi:hypothetical protein
MFGPFSLFCSSYVNSVLDGKTYIGPEFAHVRQERLET